MLGMTDTSTPFTEPSSSPRPRRVARPSWLDLRLVAGVALVLVAVLVGATVFASSDRRQTRWSASQDLAAGTMLTAQDLRPVRVALGVADTAYVPASTAVVGQTLQFALRAGELIPRAELVNPAPGITVTIPMSPQNAPVLASGDRVTVWLSTKTCRGVVLLSGVPVQRADKATGGAFTADTGTLLVVRVPARGGRRGGLGAGPVRRRHPSRPDVGGPAGAAGGRRSAVVRAGRSVIAVVTAAGGADWEAALLAELDAAGSAEFEVVRRCVDVVELLAVAGSGLAQVALVDARLRQWDADVVERLALAAVAVVGVTRPESTDEALLHAAGVGFAVPAGAPAAVIASVLSTAITELGTDPRTLSHGYADPRHGCAGHGIPRRGRGNSVRGRLGAARDWSRRCWSRRCWSRRCWSRRCRSRWCWSRWCR